jgi:undecaprenyl-diphosphatase
MESARRATARRGRRGASFLTSALALREWMPRLLKLDRAGSIGILVSLLAAVLFALLANAVADGRLQPFDEQVLRSLRDPQNVSIPLGPHWLRGTMRDITALGSPTVLVLVSLNVIVMLAVRRQHHALVFVLLAVLGGRLLNVLLKMLFARPRPDVSLHLSPVSSASFPSGHAMDSAVIYLTLGALLVSLVRQPGLKRYFGALSVLLTFLVGLSRVYLGVHYPSDVLAGWIAGVGWAALCWTLERRLQREGAVEPPRA